MFTIAMMIVIEVSAQKTGYAKIGRAEVADCEIFQADCKVYLGLDFPVIFYEARNGIR